jgi:hypothetical protein
MSKILQANELSSCWWLTRHYYNKHDDNYDDEMQNIAEIDVI